MFGIGRALPVSLLVASLLSGTNLMLHLRVAEAGDAERIVSNEIRLSRDLFARLLNAAGISEPIHLVFLNDFSTVNGYFVGGCHETLHVVGKDVQAYQSPAIYISYGVLWADRDSFPTLTAYILAHEAAHFARAVSAPHQSCEATRRAATAAETKNEEFQADRGAVLLLTRLGFDGARLAESALRTMCQRELMGCPRESSDHPTLDERITVIRHTGLEMLLQEISFPLYARADGPLVGTAFNWRPSKSHILKVVATAGHVWGDLFRYAENNPLPEEVRRFCVSAESCIPVKMHRGRSLDELIAYSEKDPIDFAYFWQASDGEQKTRYPTIASEEPAIGEICYSLGADERDNRGLAILEYLGKRDGHMLFRQTGGYAMRSGTSGSPVANSSGEIVGISVRASEEKRTVRATSVRHLAELVEGVVAFDSGSPRTDTPQEQ
jgi:hypothetical protein